MDCGIAFVSFLLAVLVTASHQADCPGDFEKKGDNCYRLFLTKKSHGEAAKACVAMGAFLAEPRSETENQIVKDVVKKHAAHVWLGATDSASEGSWKWQTNGDALTFTDWYKGEPNNAGQKGEDCLEYREATFQWNDDRCSMGHGFLCQIKLRDDSVLDRLYRPSALENHRDELFECKDPLDVAIVGAGPGGAYSAYRLRDSGKRVGLFEYSDRVGGRTYNYRLPNAPDVILQLGAMRIQEGDESKVEKVVKELGLKTSIFPDGEGRPGKTRFYLRGQSLSRWQVFNGVVPYNLTKEEKNNQHRLHEFYFYKLTGFNNWNDSNLTRHDMMKFKVADGRYLYQLTLKQAIDLVASKEGQAFFIDTIVFFSEIENDGSAIIGFQSLFQPKPTAIRTIDKGMEAVADGLVDRFLSSSGDHSFAKNMQLKSIKKKDVNMYILDFLPTITKSDTETIVLEYEKPQKWCARQVILALPVFALKQVNWLPLLDDRVEQAYNVLNTPTVNKIFMTFDRPWWLSAHNDSYVVFGTRDTLFRQMYDWGHSKKTGEYILLASYADGIGSTYLKHLNNIGKTAKGSPEGPHRVSVYLQDALLKDLALALDVPRDEVPDPKSSVSQFWSGYPFGCGWVAQRAGYYFDDVMRVQRRPSITDDVFVVGSDYAWGETVRWIEGALETVDSVIDEYFNYY